MLYKTKLQIGRLEMKFAFCVRDKPALYQVLQETANSLGKHWGNTPLIIPWLVKHDEPDYFFFDTKNGYLQADWRNRCVGGESIEAYDNRMLGRFLSEGYQVDNYDELFRLRVIKERDCWAVLKRKVVTNADEFGVITHQTNIDLWRLIHQKLEELSFSFTNRGSVPKDVTVIDVENRTFRDEWLHGVDNCPSISPCSFIWLDAADVLAWETLITETDALLAFEKMLRTGGYLEFTEMLSSDFTYMSEWDNEILDTKYSFKQFIKEKLKKIHVSGESVFGKMASWNNRPCLVLTHKSELGLKETSIFATVAGGMVTGISIRRSPRTEEVELAV